MGDKSGIEWTDATWNPVVGCSLVSPGCTHCYAMRMAARLEAMGQKKYAGTTKKIDGKVFWTGKINLDYDALTIPLRWKKPRRIFVNSMSDLFHGEIEYAFIDKVFGVMALCKRHIFQVLTKRPDEAWRYMQYSARREQIIRIGAQMVEDADDVYDSLFNEDWPLKNIMLGTSVENKRDGIPRIEALRDTPAAVRFLSIEPLLEDLGRLDLRDIHWVIVGGESGPGARPMHPNWARSIRDQCQAAGVPFFFKQWGKYNCDTDRVGNETHGRLLDGREWNEFPKVGA